ncbi:MAG: hypothetical protein GC159_16865 [Phycisphaera sp.]|nr:hypothetical protein [Phycisphaera sp.]
MAEPINNPIDGNGADTRDMDDRDFQLLAMRYIDQLITRDELDRLNAELDANPARLDWFVTTVLHGQAMTEICRTNAQRDMLLRLPDQVSSVDLRRARGGRTFRGVSRFVAAAVLLISCALGAMYLVNRPNAASRETAVYQPTGTPVATLTELTQPVWDDAGGTGLMGAGVRIDGTPMALELGYTELLLDQGAAVSVAAPARFRVTGPNSCELTRGTLLARVPTGAHGFRVTTPEMDVVDLGTVFLVHVSSSGQTEVHVLKGRVEASSMTNDGIAITRQIVTAQQAVSSAGSTDRLSSIAYDPGRFVWPSDDDAPSVRGRIQLLAAPPDSLVKGRLTSDNMVLFRERRGAALTKQDAATLAKSPYNPAGAKPHAGAHVDVYMAHLDPNTGADEKRAAHVEMTITFPRRIVGVIGTNAGLTATDATLGAPATLYDPRLLNNMGLDADDNLTISPNGRTATYVGGAYRMDEIRFLIEAD